MSNLLHSLRAMLTHARALDRPTIEAAIQEIEDHKMHIEIWRGMYNVMADRAEKAERALAAERRE